MEVHGGFGHDYIRTGTWVGITNEWANTDMIIHVNVSDLIYFGTIDMQHFSQLGIYINKMYLWIVEKKIVDHYDVVGGSPVGAAQTTSSFST